MQKWTTSPHFVGHDFLLWWLANIGVHGDRLASRGVRTAVSGKRTEDRSPLASLTNGV